MAFGSQSSVARAVRIDIPTSGRLLRAQNDRWLGNHWLTQTTSCVSRSSRRCSFESAAMSQTDVIRADPAFPDQVRERPLVDDLR